MFKLHAKDALGEQNDRPRNEKQIKEKRKRPGNKREHEEFKNNLNEILEKKSTWREVTENSRDIIVRTDTCTYS
jgi:hypothetical protein